MYLEMKDLFLLNIICILEYRIRLWLRLNALLESILILFEFVTIISFTIQYLFCYYLHLSILIYIYIYIYI